MRSKTVWIGVGILALLAGAVTEPVAGPKPVRINLGTLAPRGSAYHKSLQKLAEDWGKTPDGGVKLVVYPDGAQGSEADMVRLMRSGTLHAGLITGVGLAEIEPGVSGLQNLPMMFHDYAEYDYVSQRVQPMLQKRMEAAGFVVLFWGDTGWVHYFTRSPMRVPEDLKKLKSFVWGGGTGQIDIMKKAGYNPVALEPTDIIPGLQTGMIDSVTVPPIYALSTQIDTRAQNMLQVNWAILVGACVVTREAWDRIPESARAAVIEAANKAGNEMRTVGRNEAAEAIAAMQKRGLKVIVPDAALEAQWRTAAESTYHDIKGTVVPADIFEEVEKLIKEFRAKNKPN